MDEDTESVGEEVTKAHCMGNPLKSWDPTLRTVTLKNRSTDTVTIEHFKVQEISPSVMKWILELMTRNMKEMYKLSSKGWQPAAKRKEMSGVTSRYLIAFIDSNPVAFSHFQFDMDYGRQVLYCYEIQVDATVRSGGLGRRIMEILEKIAEQAGLPLVVLTVFKFNLRSLAFFKSIGYGKDETCPDDDENKDYVILSKKLC